MVVSKAARAFIAAISLFLLSPVLFIGLQSRDALTAFHNRSLASWPSFIHDRRTPSVYFDGVNRWLADRVYPAIALNGLRNDVFYYLLGEPPSPNITMGRNGLVFLNGTDAGHENNLVVNSCVDASDPAHLARLDAALSRIAAFGRSRNYRIDVLMFPTIPVLYGDRLPGSLPKPLRRACAASFALGGPVSAVDVPAGMRFVYPFAELMALRDDPAMYPVGNYHPVGLSVRTATDAYLRSIGATLPKVELGLTTSPSEALESRDMRVLFPAYAAVGGDAASDDDASASLTGILTPYRDDPGQVAYVFRNAAAPNPETVLVLSDSFGINQALDLSNAFRVVAQMQTPHRDISGMIGRIDDMIRFDRILFVFNDTNLGRLSEVGERLSTSIGR